MSQIDLQIGYKIKSKRRNLGISQIEMSKKLSISPSYLNLIESGKRKINVDLLLKLANELGIEISDISKKTDTNLKEETTLVTNFTDVAFGIGENYSFMWGAGVLSGGKMETSLEDGSNSFYPKNNYLGGHSIFFVLGHHGFGFETLLGYRTNFIKAEFEESNLPSTVGKTGKDFTYESNKISLTTSQVQLGIGFTF